MGAICLSDDCKVYAGERNIHNFEELLAVFNAEIDRTKEES